jgi:hypothetical protein
MAKLTHSYFKRTGNVISQWGGLPDDLRYGTRESIDIEDEAQSGHSQSGRLNIEKLKANNG